MARLNREVVITEKIDGTNAQILIVPVAACLPYTKEFLCVVPGDRSDPKAVTIFAGSRSRWLQPGKSTDNYGFAGWVKDNAEELKKLGPGRHFGEWWGGGIQRRYGLTEKRFSLFNVGRWFSATPFDGAPGVFQNTSLSDETPVAAPGPACCHVVPTIWRGTFDLFDCRSCVEILRSHGSFAAPGFKDPEGIVIYHEAAKKCFKVTIKDDGFPKSLAGDFSPEAVVEMQNQAAKEAIHGD